MMDYKIHINILGKNVGEKMFSKTLIVEPDRKMIVSADSIYATGDVNYFSE